MDLLSDPQYFRCARMSATIKKAYCVELQDRLAAAVLARSPNAKHLLEDEIKLSRCRNCPTGWRNRKEIEQMTEPTKKCTKCGEEKSLEKDFRRKKAAKDGYDNVCKVCVSKREAKWEARKKLRKIATVKLAERRRNKKIPDPSKLVPPSIPARPRSFMAEMVADVVHAAENGAKDEEVATLIESAYLASLYLSVKLRALMEKV